LSELWFLPLCIISARPFHMAVFIKNLHPWTVTPREAVNIQVELKDKLSTLAPKHEIRIVAGADVSYSKTTRTCFASIVVVDLQEMRMIDHAHHVAACSFPYIPGLLTFREGPPLLEAFLKLGTEPHAVIFDGQGQAHPRGMGVAAHLGLFIDLPTVGCAKTRLTGTHEEVGSEPGDYVLLERENRAIGAVVRTRRKVKPLYVSPGHLMDLRGAIDLVIRSCSGYRIPEPLRLAHLHANRLRQTETDLAP
jgi:deoxyribonuclease V